MFRSKNWKKLRSKKRAGPYLYTYLLLVPVQARSRTARRGKRVPPFSLQSLRRVRGTSGRLDWKCRDVPMPMPSVVPIDTRPPAQPGILFLPRLSRLIFLSFLLSVFLILLLLPFQPSRRPWFVCSVFSKSPPAAASPIVKSTIRL